MSLTAIILIIITASTIYAYQNDPQTQEKIWLRQVRQKLDAPITAKYLGKKEYDLINSSITVYSWRQNNTLYEAQIDEQGVILKTESYQHHNNESQMSMTPALAETLAQQRLITETWYPPGNPYLSDPTFDYISFRPEGPYWTVSWGLHVDNYTISNVDFEVQVYTETGKTKIVEDDFKEITELPEYDPPNITADEASEIAVQEYRRNLNYTIIDSAKPGAIRISSPEGLLDYVPPLTLIWHVTVRGMGVSDGVPVRRNPTYYIDAYSGEIYCGIYISVGWDEINWTTSRYPYYGSEYPITILNYPHDYEFPETKDDRIRVYNITHNKINLAWEYLILTLDQNTPKTAYYWSRAYDGVKTSVLAPLDSVEMIKRHSQIIDGRLVVLDTVTGETILSEEYHNIGEPVNTLNITREQAINITSTSSITDPENKIITSESLVLAEPRIIKPDWISLLTYIGDFRRLYIVDVNQTEPRLYWLIEYALYPEAHGGYTGIYLVDAETGEIALALEDYPLPDLLFRGYAPEKITLRRGETISFNITVKAASTLEAQLPVTLTVDQIPMGVTADIQRDTLQLSNSKIATFKVTLNVSPEASKGIYFTSFGLRLLGRGTSAHFNLEITE